MFLFVGTFTNGFQRTAPGRGIIRLALEPETGKLVRLGDVSGLNSPTFLVRHPTLPLLYAAEREWSADEPDEGGVSLFEVSTDNGDLRLIDRYRSQGDFPSHISMSRSGHKLFVSHARDAKLCMFDVLPDGCLRPDVKSVTLHGRGARQRQFLGSWLHSAFADGADKRVLACDLHTDRVLSYRFDGGELALAEQPVTQVSSGAGPRHLAFHPAGDAVYVINEFDSTISVFGYGEQDGDIIIRQTVSTLPRDVFSDNATGEIVVAPNGRFLYCSNRGENNIAGFSIDPITRRLRLIGHFPSGGVMPRHIAIDSKGELLVAANQMTGSLVSFRVDQNDGSLVELGRCDAECPVCVLIWE